jgi:hypothetical protein
MSDGCTEAQRMSDATLAAEWAKVHGDSRMLHLMRECAALRAEALRRGHALVAIQDAGYSNDHYQRVTHIAKACLAQTPPGLLST